LTININNVENLTSQQVKETDFYTAEWEILQPEKGRLIRFKHEPREYQAQQYDWYMLVALEKAELVKTDRHLLTSSLLIGYRHAIREAYNHDLEGPMKQWQHPRNQNSIEGIRSYIKRIGEKSQARINSILS
jgi:hypothetical protein